MLLFKEGQLYKIFRCLRSSQENRLYLYNDFHVMCDPLGIINWKQIWSIHTAKYRSVCIAFSVWSQSNIKTTLTGARYHLCSFLCERKCFCIGKGLREIEPATN